MVIHTSVTLEFSMPSRGRRQQLLEDQLGWLKAMKAAGLHDTLQSIKSFSDAQMQISSEKKQPETNGVFAYPSVMSENIGDEEPRSVSPKVATLAEVASRNVSDPRPNRLEAEPLFLPMPENIVVEYPNNTEGEYVVPDQNQILLGENPHNLDIRERWSTRNISVFQLSGGGNEVWIRDSGLDVADVKVQMSDLHFLKSELKGQIKKLAVNGQVVYSVDSRKE